MNKEYLLKTRQQIIESLSQLLLTSEGSPSDRFEMIITAIRAGAGSNDLYNKAIETVGAMETAESKQQALFDLLSEIELDLGNLEDNPDETAKSAPLPAGEPVSNTTPPQQSPQPNQVADRKSVV